MGDFFQTLLFVIIGIILLSLGYFLFFGPPSPFYQLLPWNKKKVLTGKPGDPQICPVCSMKMLKGDSIRTIAITSGEYSTSRIVHIKGCYSCLEKGLPRKCPICGTVMSLDDYLISRMFERNYRKNHVHILGCNNCRKNK